MLKESSQLGRPPKEFLESCERVKRRKTETLRGAYSSVALSYAAQMSMRAEGKNEAASLIKQAINPCLEVKEITAEKALAIIVRANLTKSAYEIIREPAKDRYPSYHKVADEKRKCYPADNFFIVTEISVKIVLQGVLDKTVERLLLFLEKESKGYCSTVPENLVLMIKWGCDGASGIPEYKQKFANSAHKDSHVFFTSFVPLRLSSEEDIIWDNRRPGSPFWCRPVHLQFLPETDELILQECEQMSDEINNLRAFETTFCGKKVVITYSLFLTMIDGKIVNTLTGTSSAQRCYACNATISQFNDLNRMEKVTATEDFLKFGISSLHAWIRCFECLIKISYRLEFKRWRKNGKEDIFNATKKRIQEAFRQRMGLLIDKPKQGGAGNSNDGNTARKFFNDPETSSEITGIDCVLITRIRNILIAITCGEDIDPNKFKVYCMDTAKLYVSLYPWYYMPTCMHRVLIHGHDIMRWSVLPIGRMSEEAQERSNKSIRKCRESFSRKNCRENTNRDIFNRILITSDPLVNSHLEAPKKYVKSLPEDIKLMLKHEILSESSSESEEGEN